MAKIEDILDRCLTSLEHGDSVEACLVRYPDHRDELEPLLRAVEGVRSVPNVAPSAAFRQGARDRMVRMIQYHESVKGRDAQPKRPGLLERLWPDFAVSVPVRRLAMPAVAAMAVIVLLGGLGFGAVYASSESLPGNSLYPVKMAAERIHLAVSLSETNDARIRLRSANERIREAAELVERDKVDDIDPLMSRYAAEIEAANGILQRERAEGRDVSSLARHFQEQLAWQERALNRVREQLPRGAQSAVERALAASRAAQHGAPELREEPQASSTVEPRSTATTTATPTPSERPSHTPNPTETATPTDTAQPAERSEPSETPVPPGQTMTPQPPETTMTPEPPGETMTPWPPGRTITPEPPGRTMTPEPPGPPDTPGPTSSPGNPGTLEPGDI